MMTGIKGINHLAIIVDDFDKALPFWQDALGLQVQGIEEVPEEQVSVAFIPLGASKIELIKPESSNSGVAKYLERRGAGLHHVCLEVDDLDALLARFVETGIRMINDVPRTSPDGRRYAFVHPKSTNGVLVELYEVTGRD